MRRVEESRARATPAGLVARLLGAELHPGEGPLVALFAFDLFLLLTAYYVLKVVREPLILLEGGAVSRSYARGLEAIVLLFLLPGYSYVATRVSARRLVDWMSASFIVALAGFWWATRAGLHVGFVFFVWLGIFSTLSIAQFWSLANDLFSEARGRRLFPLVACGGTVGGIVGAQLAARASTALSPGALMMISAGILIAYLVTRLAPDASWSDARPGTAGPSRPRWVPRAAFG
jgi:AAA family ATP:ADP antiporter